MLRLVLLAVALTGVLATAHPASADPVAATPSDHAQVAATTTEQPVPSAPAWSSAPAMVPAGTERGKDIPVGFGWG
jgi:hypothetical protein